MVSFRNKDLLNPMVKKHTVLNLIRMNQIVSSWETQDKMEEFDSNREQYCVDAEDDCPHTD